MIGKVIKALVDKDCKALTSCFAENCEYIDYCPCLGGGQNIFIYGSSSLEMFFRYKFISNGMEIAEPIIESEKSATCFSTYDGPYIYSRLNIEECDGSGLIRKLVVHPA